MKKLNFICTFKSDIVLHASSNTEGKIERLDYIPGSNFLGMVARAYGDFGSDAFDVFHSGEVCFSDGHILLNNMATLAMPFSFQTYKGVSFEEAVKSEELFVHHHLVEKDFDEATKKGTQLKQQRDGFFSVDGTLAKYEHSYKQKSAYDKNKRHSKKGSMFGYHALPAGTKWAFSVTMSDEMATKYEDKIIELLEKANRLGKSKSAEYGLVKIEYKNEENITGSTIIAQTIAHENNKKYLYLYAKSRLVLTDKCGVNTYTPNIESLGFSASDDVKIDWNKSQIRTSRYTPYVGARRNFDPERLIINKGSVIVLELLGAYDESAFATKIQNPIGLYISEGHGEVIVNPSWLVNKKVTFTSAKASGKDAPEEKTLDYNNSVNDWFTVQRKEQKRESDLLVDVVLFIGKNSVEDKKSQWGQIRSLCRQAKSSDDLYDLLFSYEERNGHPEGFLRHGRGMEKWDNEIINNLETQKKKLGDDYKKFVTLLSIYAPKEDDKKGGE